MKSGFIGAGKVGCSLGKYFASGGYTVAGYADCEEQAAVDAATFTGTKHYAVLEKLVEDSDILFLTVADGVIGDVWKQIKQMPVAKKMICHTSGAVSSAIFSGISETGAYGYSLHPLYAVHSKWTSYQELSQAVFTIEGDEERLADMKELIERLGNSVEIISAASKAKYHAAAVFASNYVTALAKITSDLLVDCGFSKEGAAKAFLPLMEGNVANIAEAGIAGALTGPIERNDVTTLKRHQDCLGQEEWKLYRRLAKPLVAIAKEKYPDRDYGEIEGLLQEG